MGSNLNRGDMEYGWPSFDHGTVFSPSTNCVYFELLEYTSPNGATFSNSSGELDDSSIEQWLLKDVAKQDNGANNANQSLTGSLRLLFGESTYDTESKCSRLPFTEGQFNCISNSLQLPPQFLPSMSASLSRSFKMSCSPSTSSVFSPTICFIFKVALHEAGQYHLALSYSPTTNVTYALVIYRPRFQSPTPPAAYSAVLNTILTNASLAAHPLLLPILLTDLSIQSSEPRIQSADHRLNELESLAGQHEWVDLRAGDPLNLDFAASTKALNFTSRCLGMELWRCKANLLILENVRTEIPLLGGSERCRVVGKRLKELVECHINTCHNLLLRIEFEEKRAQTQISVVYQFMAQKDSKVNIRLAETTAFIAKESKKDGSAMKAIAVLTMCFLPGTFLAALFAMPLFNWDGGDRPMIKEGFKYYWAIAIPLTLAVLLVWAASMILPWRRWLTVARRRRGLDVEAAQGERMKDE